MIKITISFPYMFNIHEIREFNKNERKTLHTEKHIEN
jgi:hypothetical protein